MAAIAAKFSEEDLTRYLQLSLDLFKDLQFSLQPRFHLEIGLLRLVHAGKLLPIEEALAALPRAAAPPGTGTGGQGPGVVKASPFELDRARKAGRPEPQAMGGPAAAVQAAPSPTAATVGVIDWRTKLHGVLMELGLPFTADAVEHSLVAEGNGELVFTTPKDFSLGMNADDINKAVRQIIGRPLRIKLTTGETGPLPEAAPPAPEPQADDTAARALSHPEVRRFREVFGGEVRDVRNLKE